MIHADGLAAAVPTGPVVPMQHGAAQQRVDPALLGVGRRRVPMEERMRRRWDETHHYPISSRICTRLDNPSSGVCCGQRSGVRVRLVAPLELLGEGGEI